jgi:hypothetical protein
MIMMIMMMMKINFGFQKWQKISCQFGRLLIVKEVELMEAYYGVTRDRQTLYLKTSLPAERLGSVDARV